MDGRLGVAVATLLAVSGCASPPLDEVTRLVFNGEGNGSVQSPPFDCDGRGRVEATSATPEGWLYFWLTDPTGQEAVGQVLDGAPDSLESREDSFPFTGSSGPGWILSVDRQAYGDGAPFSGSYDVRVSC